MRESSNVLMLGPGLNVRGGVSGVERLLLGRLPENVTPLTSPPWSKAASGPRP